jgi:hypothetical protein
MTVPTRTVPPYVRSSDWEDEEDPSPSTRPPHALVRMSMTLPLVGRRISQSRRPFHGKLEQEPLANPTSYGSRWAEFMVATGAPRTQATREQQERAASIYGEYDRRREENRTLLSEKAPQAKRRDAIYLRTKRTLMKNAFVPLIFRFFVLIMSTAALGLSGSIFHHFSQYHHEVESACKKGPSTYMAVIVGCLAIIYTSYIAWDEFSSKPLGLRRPSSKLKLLLLDLVFVVFMSANVSLAFEALWLDTFPCGNNDQSCSFEPQICARQRALVGVLMIAIVAWLSTFIVSLYRLVFQVEATRGTIG